MTIANQKGGVSKTAVCQHLAYALTEQGLRVLLVLPYIRAVEEFAFA